MAKPVPEFCDFECPHAGFPPAETAGICRTMAAVWCRKLKEIVNKNALCEWAKRNATRARRAETRRRKPAHGRRPVKEPYRGMKRAGA